MAYMRSLSNRVTLLTQRFHPSLSYILHHDDDGKRQPPVEDSSQPTIDNFLQRRGHNRNISNVTTGSSALFQDRGCLFFSLPAAGLGSSFCSYSSSVGEGSDKIQYVSDIAEILSEKSLEVAAAQVPVVNEVAIAAADSAFPVAALQYLIDGVHSFTGLNWWASIALTTILIRGATIPFLINQHKATSKLTLMRPRLEQIKQQMQDVADPEAVAEGQKRMTEIFKEYGVTPFTPLKGLLIQGPIFMSFYFAITNMVEKVPSFKEGGAFWFTDLTTPDSLYIFPVLTSLTFLLTVECNMQEGLEGNPVAGTMKSFFRILAFLTVPFTMNFPKALFCYWVASNTFSLMYGLVIKRPQVKKLLGFPEIPVTPTTVQQPASSPVLTSKPSVQVTQEEPSISPVEPSKISDRRISSSSVISQRIRSLEKQMKAKKKNKKR